LPQFYSNHPSYFISNIGNPFTITMKFRSKSKEADSSGHGLATLSTPRSGTQLTMLNLADNNRNNVVAVLGEFVGTFLFLFWSFVGTQISNTPVPPDGSPPNTSALLFAALAFGFSLTVNVWAFFRITGGLFNPSVRSSVGSCCSRD
jgi:aquaporin rerated protein, other eukaryote